eukprot:6487658-Amphidinium_carterae.1
MFGESLHESLSSRGQQKKTTSKSAVPTLDMCQGERGDIERYKTKGWGPNTGNTDNAFPAVRSMESPR